MELYVEAWDFVVPAALVTPGELENSKGTFNKVFQAWFKKAEECSVIDQEKRKKH